MEEIAGGKEVRGAGRVEGADCKGYCAGEWFFCEVAEDEGEEVGGDGGVKEEEGEEEEDFTTELAEGPQRTRRRESQEHSEESLWQRRLHIGSSDSSNR